MADFQPTTTVYLFESTGVDRGNQPYFTSEGAKIGWYMSHITHSYDAYSYQRETRQYIRVKDKADNIRKCDMMAFRNGDAKWILCRITAITWINPNCAEVEFETDSMQTFIENIIWQQCWVEREMQDDDWNGGLPSYNNLQPEGLETGVMMRESVDQAVVEIDSWELVVLSAYDRNGEPNFNVVSSNNIPSGLNMFTFPIPANGTMAGLSDMLKTYADKGIDVSKAIVGLFVVPAGSTSNPKRNTPKNYPMHRNNFDGYNCVNAKCMTGEFLRLCLGNRRGEESELRPEFLGDQVSLMVESAFANGNGGMILFPVDYQEYGPNYGVVLYNDVQAPFTSNAFSAWIQSNGATMASNAIAGTVSSAVTGTMIGGVVGGVTMGMTSAVTSAISAIGKILDKAKDPVAVGGQASGNSLYIALGRVGFDVSWLRPTKENLQCIDEFFSRFGYRTNRLKKPNVDTRPLWNYVKTSGAVVRGQFDKSDQIEIQQNLDNGVTFWHVPAANIGDYSNMMGNKG